MIVAVQALTWAEGESWCSARASTLAVTPVPQEVTMGFSRSTPAPLNTCASCSGPCSFPSWSTWRASNPLKLQFKPYPYTCQSKTALRFSSCLQDFAMTAPTYTDGLSTSLASLCLAGQPLRACLAATSQTACMKHHGSKAIVRCLQQLAWVKGTLIEWGKWPARTPWRGSGSLPENRSAPRASTTCSCRLSTLSSIWCTPLSMFPCRHQTS